MSIRPVLTNLELTNWLINAFNGEWLKVANAKPNGLKA